MKKITYPWMVCLLGVLMSLTGCSVNPLTGEKEFMLYSPENDIKLGAKVAPDVEKELDGRIEDEALQAYIDRIGQKIARVCNRPDWEYHFVAVETEMVNAMALPGGYVFITRGMLEKLDSEAQLAAILGHEVGHVVARDTAAALSKQAGMTILMAAVMVAEPKAANMAQMTGQILMLSYSRQDEQQADLAGLRYMYEAGYNPEGMMETMRILQDMQKVRPVEFFSTHPLPENRLGYIGRHMNAWYGSDYSDRIIGKDDYEHNILDYLATHPKPKRPKAPEQKSDPQDEQTVPGFHFQFGSSRYECLRGK